MITSTSVCPSWVCVTAVTSSPGIPGNVTAARPGHGGAPARLASPGEPVASGGGGSFCGFLFLGRNDDPSGNCAVCQLQ